MNMCTKSHHKNLPPQLVASTSTSQSWYGEMSPTIKKTFWGCFWGYALDAFDLQIYSFVIPPLVALWAMSNAQAGFIATTALAISAFGGWLAGMLCDRIGRVKVLQITIAWFAFFTFLSGFTENFTQLLIVRGLQGFGFGGEWAAGAVLIGEVVNAKHRGKAVGFVQSAWAWGWGIAALAATAVFQLASPDTAWRLLFFLGGLPALIIVFIRRSIPESEVFLRAQQQPHVRGNLLRIFSKEFIATTALGSLLAVGAHGGYYAITTWLPTYLKTERKLSNIGSGGYLAFVIFGSMLGYMAGAYLSDSIGRRKTFALFAVGAILVAIGYTNASVPDAMVLFLGLPLGFLSAGLFSGFGPLYTELFPTPIRATGQGFCYNFGRGFAAAMPTLVGVMSTSMPLGQAICITASTAYAVVVIVSFCLPETSGRALR